MCKKNNIAWFHWFFIEITVFCEKETGIHKCIRSEGTIKLLYIIVQFLSLKEPVPMWRQFPVSDQTKHHNSWRNLAKPRHLDYSLGCFFIVSLLHLYLYTVNFLYWCCQVWNTIIFFKPRVKRISFGPPTFLLFQLDLSKQCPLTA